MKNRIFHHFTNSLLIVFRCYLFISRLSSRMSRVLRNASFALPMPDHASSVWGEASLDEFSSL